MCVQPDIWYGDFASNRLLTMSCNGSVIMTHLDYYLALARPRKMRCYSARQS
jgi:hypothetical protein